MQPFSPTIKTVALISSTSFVTQTNNQDKLAKIRKWKKDYNWYLERGYAADYMPEDVVEVLEEMPGCFRHIWYVGLYLVISSK